MNTILNLFYITGLLLLKGTTPTPTPATTTTTSTTGKSCNGTNYDIECCSIASPCAINEGDCDNESECQGNLICGRDNCPAPFPSKADCCESPFGKNCDGVNYDGECCSVAAPCAINEGDCDSDSECQGNLICGSNNCPSHFPSGAECCESPFGINGNSSKLIVTLKGQAKSSQSSVAGIYTLDPKPINDKSHWLQSSGSNSIWCGKDGFWSIGFLRKFHKVVSFDKVSSPEEATTWRYWNGSDLIRSDDILVEAGSKAEFCGDIFVTSTSESEGGLYVLSNERASAAPNNPVWKNSDGSRYIFNTGNSYGWRIGQESALTSGRYYCKGGSQSLPIQSEVWRSNDPSICGSNGRVQVQCTKTNGVLPKYARIPEWMKKPKTNTRIVGGNDAPAPIPWQVHVHFEKSGVSKSCGGTIINEDTILSAAHCYYPLVNASYIEAGIKREGSSKGQKIDIDAVIMHPFYNPFNNGQVAKYDNDIAILKLKKPLTFNADVLAAHLPDSTLNPELKRTSAIISGWGTIRSGGPSSNVLQFVSVPILEISNCTNLNKLYSPTNITSNMICAGDLINGGKDSCQGDSGGPMVIPYNNNDDTAIIYGIVSWGNGCARENGPGMYTRVSNYNSWIQNNMNKKNKPKPETDRPANGAFPCGDVNADSGKIQSLNYPNYYPNNEDCIWKITTPSGSIVTLEFETPFDVR